MKIIYDGNRINIFRVEGVYFRTFFPSNTYSLKATGDGVELLRGEIEIMTFKGVSEVDNNGIVANPTSVSELYLVLLDMFTPPLASKYTQIGEAEDRVEEFTYDVNDNVSTSTRNSVSLGITSTRTYTWTQVNGKWLVTKIEDNV
jgi:hypothetical protein